ncbi:MAG: Gfo/Idh/MocA family oxidoreductase [Lentisphaeria bacterium]|nr:Gfo/Idh/MocA family oxidoreductase [Lentisphaeria bacterium]
MLKVCINFETGNGRLDGHFTEFAFTGLPGVEIAALADSNPAAQATYHLTGAKRFYTSYLEMMETEKPDIVILCSRLPDEHYEQIKYALEHHCHVLCEKPLASDLFQADELLALARKNHCQVQIAHLARFAPAFHKMREMIRAGEIGRVLSCYMRGKEDNRGGGEDMLVLGTHIFDAACWLFGLPEQVYADIRWQGRAITCADAIATSEPLGPCGGDDIFALYRFPGEINGFFESRRDLVPKCDTRFGLTVCGTKGALTIRYSGNRELRISRDFPVPIEDQTTFEVIPSAELPEIPGAEAINMADWHIDPQYYCNHYYVENNRRAAWDLLQAIQTASTPEAGIESALHSLEMITGAYQSAIAHAPVKLPLVDRKHPLA